MRKKNKTLFLLILCCLLVISGCSQRDDKKLEHKIKKLESNQKAIRLVGNKSLDNFALIYSEKKQGIISNLTNYYIVTNNDKFGPFESIGQVEFSPDNKTIAYDVKIDGKWYVFSRGEKAGPYDRVEVFEFSPDSKTIGYYAKIHDKWYFTVGKEKFGPFDVGGIAGDEENYRKESSYSRRFAFSSDGSIVAYVAIINGSMYVVSNNEKAGPYDHVGLLRFLSDGKTPVYEARMNNDAFIFIGREKCGPFENYLRVIAGYTPDGEIVSCASLSNNKWYVVSHAGRMGPYEMIDYIAYSPIDKISAYSAKINGKWYVIAGNEKTGPFEDINSLVYSPDGKTLAYYAMTDGKWYVIVGNEKYGPYEKHYFSPVEFSSDSKIFAYTAEMNGKDYVLADKEKAGPYDYVGYNSLKFSPDSKMLAYGAEIEGKGYAVIGKEKFGPYDSSISEFAFSKDNKVVYKAKINGKWYVFFGKEKLGPYAGKFGQDGVLGLKFLSDGKTLAYNASLNDKWDEWYVIADEEKYGYSGIVLQVVKTEISPNGKILFYDPLKSTIRYERTDYYGTIIYDDNDVPQGVIYLNNDEVIVWKY